MKKIALVAVATLALAACGGNTEANEVAANEVDYNLAEDNAVLDVNAAAVDATNAADVALDNAAASLDNAGEAVENAAEEVETNGL